MLAESIIMEQIEMEWVLEHQLEKRAEECDSEQKCLLSSLDLVGTDGFLSHCSSSSDPSSSI